MADGARISVPADAGVVVRRATADDAEALAGLLAVLGYPAEANAVEMRLARMADDPRVLVMVAVVAGDPAPAGLCTAHVLTTIHADADVAQITALVVSERVRGRGVGRRLVGEAERWARERGAGKVTVTTALHRHGAHAFYESIGYDHTGRRYVRAIPPG